MKKISFAFLFAAVVACGGGSKPSPEPGGGGTPISGGGDDKPCVAGGCSGTLCSDVEGLASTCEWKPEYACYRDAECTRQADGACGWTQTETLTACIAEPPAE